MKKAIKATKIFLLIVCSAIVVYDIIIAVSGNMEATVSNITYWAGIRLAFIPYAWGVLSSHFFMSKPGRFLFGTGNWRYAVWIPLSLLILLTSTIGKSTSFILWITQDNLWCPLLLGLMSGLLWAQEKPSHPSLEPESRE